MGEAPDGGEHLAPVIPLFGPAAPGARAARPERARRTTDAGPTHPTERIPAGGAPRDDAASGRADASAPDGADRWHTTWRDLGRERMRPAPAPVFSTVERGGVRVIEVGDGGDAAAAGDRSDAAAVGDGGDAAATGDVSGASAPEPARVAAAAERKLVRSLASRGLSISEARAKLRQQDLPAELVDDIIERLVRTGALDDDRLAEQLVHAATSRKKQGRRAIAQSLAARGIPRDAIDSALADLPDDDAERALEFARAKAAQLARYDDDTALRRLVGQLARRGFGGSMAMSAARRALDEARRPGGRVRFD